MWFVHEKGATYNSMVSWVLHIKGWQFWAIWVLQVGHTNGLLGHWKIQIRPNLMTWITRESLRKMRQRQWLYFVLRKSERHFFFHLFAFVILFSCVVKRSGKVTFLSHFSQIPYLTSHCKKIKRLKINYWWLLQKFNCNNLGALICKSSYTLLTSNYREFCSNWSDSCHWINIAKNMWVALLFILRVNKMCYH